MPIEPASWLMAGAQLLDTAANTGSTAWANSENQRFNREMYERQKRDNLKQWHLQNSYNSPIQQMSRLRKAGLNPNLVYNNGGANAGAAPLPAVSGSAPTVQAPKFNFADSISAYQNMKQQEAQTDNLLAQNDVIRQDAMLRSYQTANEIIKSNRGTWEANQAKELGKHALEAAKLGVEQQHKNMAYVDAQTNNTKTNTERQALENNLLRLGINPSDPTWVRAIAQFMQGNVSVSQIINGIRKKMR